MAQHLPFLLEAEGGDNLRSGPIGTLERSQDTNGCKSADHGCRNEQETALARSDGCVAVDHLHRSTWTVLMMIMVIGRVR